MSSFLSLILVSTTSRYLSGLLVRNNVLRLNLWPLVFVWINTLVIDENLMFEESQCRRTLTLQR